MLEQGLGRLIVKMLVSLTMINDQSAFRCRREVQLTIGSFAFDVEKRSAHLAQEELVICGIIRALFRDLNSCDPNTQDPNQHIRITDCLFSLSNLGRCTKCHFLLPRGKCCGHFDKTCRITK